MHALFGKKVYEEDNFQNEIEPDGKSELIKVQRSKKKAGEKWNWMHHEFVIKIIHVSMENVNEISTMKYYYVKKYQSGNRTYTKLPTTCVKKNVSTENREREMYV